MQFIERWKEAWKLNSVRAALVYAIYQWFNTIVVEQGLPETVEGWINNFVGLFFILARIVYQPELHALEQAAKDEHEDNSVG